MIIYSIYDCAADRFLPPLQLMDDDVSAIRAFRSFVFRMVVDNQTVVDGVDPHEFALYRVGEINLQSGEISAGMVTRVCDAMRVLSDPNFKAIVDSVKESQKVGVSFEN